MQIGPLMAANVTYIGKGLIVLFLNTKGTVIQNATDALDQRQMNASNVSIKPRLISLDIVYVNHSGLELTAQSMKRSVTQCAILVEDLSLQIV